MIHKDIKPENLLFDEKGYIRIADFGTSRFKYNSNKQQINGTLSYMAPELFKNHDVSFEADFYAVGCIIYELATGNFLYQTKD